MAEQRIEGDKAARDLDGTKKRSRQKNPKTSMCSWEQN